MSVINSGTIEVGGRTVHRLGFGAMRITGDGIWGPPRDHDEAIRVLRRAVELGVDFIDTADSYGPYVSEDLIREALHDGTGYGDVVIATKGGLTRSGPNVWPPLGRPEYLRQCILMSLRRLGVDRIDLWQLHRIDPKTPREETFAEVKSFVDEGLARQVGLSEVGVDEIQAALDFGIPVASVQNRYNLGDREWESVVDFCDRESIGFIPWYPLAVGKLAKPGGVLTRIAEKRRATPAQVALAWLLRRTPVMLPIPGTSKVKHLEENMAAAAITLSDADAEALAKAAS
jgi:pyridoxine 4-dehydrogenase